MISPRKQPPDEADLRVQQLRLTNQKLQQDIKKAKAELRPEKWWTQVLKSVLSVGGVVTVLASGYGIYDSYTKTLTDREHTRVADAKSRIDEAINRLDSGSIMSKLSSTATLGGYLDRTNQDLHRQIFYVFTSVMATQDDEQSQSSIVDFISAIPTDGSVRAEDWEYFVNTLTSQSRELVSRGSLIEKHQLNPAAGAPTNRMERLAGGIGKLIATIVRKRAMKTFTNFSNIYCVGCDFTGAQFIDNSKFSESVLDWANFSRAIIRKANFDDASLIGTIFISSDLRDNYLSMLTSQSSVLFTLSDFSCADLTDVEFSGRVLFPAGFDASRTYPLPSGAPKPDWYANISASDSNQAKIVGGKFRALYVAPPKFFKANLTGTNFGSTKYFLLADKGADDLILENYTLFDISEFELDEGELSQIAFGEPSSLKIGAKTESGDEITSDIVKAVREFQQLFFASFFRARNIDKAKLSKGAAELLSRLPEIGDYESFLGSVTTTKQVFDCVPR